MENRSPIFLSLAAAAALAACATDSPLSAAVVATPVVSSPAIAYPADTAASAPSGVWVQTAVALRPGVAASTALAFTIETAQAPLPKR